MAERKHIEKKWREGYVLQYIAHIFPERPVWSWSRWIWQSEAATKGSGSADVVRIFIARLAWPRGARSGLTIPQWKVRDITRDLNKSISHASRYLYHHSRHRRCSRAEFSARCRGQSRRCRNSQCGFTSPPTMIDCDAVYQTCAR